ncbi:MAG: phospholipase D-like domain-containing protein [Candidatus Omnitrophota bacterium]
MLVVLAGAGILLCYAAESYQAVVEDISGRKYYPAAQKAIQQAKDSIYMVMYQVSLRPYNTKTQVYDLADELVNAHKRGVKVKVILDENINFAGEKSVNKWVAEGKNSRCFRMLKDAGIDVRYDNPSTYTHAKVLVIDEEAVILGSTNWTESALNQNYEASVLIKSKELAARILKSFGEIKTQERPPAAAQPVQGGVTVSWQFLENPNLGGRMLTRHDQRAFDLYLVLLKEYDASNKAKIAFNYEKTASYLGIADKMTREGYRRQINRSLNKLKDDYNLIDCQLNYDKDAEVDLLSYDKPPKPYSEPKEWYFQVPDGYWEYGWSSKLSHSAKFCYLINLAYANISNTAPWWFSGREALAKRFNISKWAISNGMQELRKLNLIDVSYDTPEGGVYSSRLANAYKVLPLYDPAWLELEWDRLEVAYGSKKLKQAKKYAKIVFKQNDPQAVEDIILRMDAFGEDKVKKAFSIVAKKRVDNPKRCYEYVKGILFQAEAQKEQ